jgi:hypothetical protein
MNWLRNNDPNLADVDNPTAQGLVNPWATHAGRESVSGEGQLLRIQNCSATTSSSRVANELTLRLRRTRGSTQCRRHLTPRKEEGYRRRDELVEEQ